MAVWEQIGNGSPPDLAGAGGSHLPAHDAFLLESYRWGSPRLPLDELASPLAKELAQAMLGVSIGERDTALEEKLALLPDQVADGVRYALVAVDIFNLPLSGSSAAGGQPAADGPLAPPLPESVLDGASPDSWLVARERDFGEFSAPWVDAYVAYAGAIVPMCPELFHTSAALCLPAIAIARRLVVPMAYGDVYPNLFVTWIAESTIWHKTTALNVARHLAQDLFPHLMAAQDTTPEAFLSDLAGMEPRGLAEMSDDARATWLQERNFCAQRGLVLDEMSGLLASVGRDYNAGLVESLLRFYDCERRFTRSTRGVGRVNVRNSCLSLLGASTPAALAPHLTSLRLWTMGWWPRFALLTPEEERPEWCRPRRTERPPELVRELRELYDRLPRPEWPAPPEAVVVSLGEHTFADWERYTKAVSHDLIGPGLDQRLYSVYGRLPTQLIKLSTILAALQWPEDLTAPRIERHHMARAITIAESWRESAHRAVRLGSESRIDRLEAGVLAALPAFLPQGATFRQLSRRVPGADPRELRELLPQMEEAGTVLRLRVSPPGAGRPSERYLPGAAP